MVHFFNQSKYLTSVMVVLSVSIMKRGKLTLTPLMAAKKKKLVKTTDHTGTEVKILRHGIVTLLSYNITKT